MIFSERKRIKEIEARETKGESLWRSDVPSAFRNKFERIVAGFGYVVNEYDEDFGSKEIASAACAYIAAARGEGERPLSFHIHSTRDELYPDVIEAVALVVKYYAKEKGKKLAVESFHSQVNELLESYRICYTLENCEVVTFESREIHQKITVPALRLLATSGWEAVEKAYQDALKELSNGNTGNAITDATTALQEALRKVGCKGEDFATLLKSAKSTVLKGYDAKYVDAISSLINWASANRVNRGDSHKVIDADKEDAWFVLHVIGILILRLSKVKLNS